MGGHVDCVQKAIFQADAAIVDRFQQQMTTPAVTNDCDQSILGGGGNLWP